MKAVTSQCGPRSLTQALHQVARRGVIDESASALIRLLSQIASRFGVVVSQKVAAQAVPVLGAISGAAVNSVFVGHFQTLARGAFHGAPSGADLRKGNGPRGVRANPGQPQRRPLSPHGKSPYEVRVCAGSLTGR